MQAYGIRFILGLIFFLGGKKLLSCFQKSQRLAVNVFQLPECHYLVKYHLCKLHIFSGFSKIVSRNKRFSVAAFQQRPLSVTGGQHIRTQACACVVRMKGKNSNPVANAFKKKQSTVSLLCLITESIVIVTLVLSLFFLCLIHHRSGITVVTDVVYLTSCIYFFSAKFFPQVVFLSFFK